MEKGKIRTGAEIALILVLMVSLGVNINSKDQGYLPYSCKLENVQDMMCYKLSRVNDDGIQRNCYYDRDNSKKYKVCSAGWERILNVDEFMGLECPECPKCEDTICPKCSECGKCPTTCPPCTKTICPECIQTCKGCGGGGGSCNCPSCPSCPACVNCEEVNVIAYVDNIATGETDKWFCDGIGIDANCVKDGDLSMPFG